MYKFVLLDRDGTIIEDVHFLSSPTQIRFLPKAIEGLLLLKSFGFKLFIVSNQSGVARGYFSLEKLKMVDREIKLLLDRYGVHIEDSLYCPHHPNERCRCRKPDIWLGKRLIWKYGLEISPCSFAIGDSERDVEMGKRLGIRTVKIGGYSSIADYVADNLLTAARWIVSCSDFEFRN